MPAEPTGPALAGPSIPLRIVVGIVAAEALLLFAVAVFTVGETLLGRPTDTTAAAVIAALAALAGAFLLFCGRGLWRRQRWARGPVMFWQLLQLLTVVTTTFSAGWIAASLAVVSVAAGAGLLLPRVVAETTVPADPPVT